MHYVFVLLGFFIGLSSLGHAKKPVLSDENASPLLSLISEPVTEEEAKVRRQQPATFPMHAVLGSEGRPHATPFQETPFFELPTNPQ